MARPRSASTRSSLGLALVLATGCSGPASDSKSPAGADSDPPAPDTQDSGTGPELPAPLAPFTVTRVDPVELGLPTTTPIGYGGPGVAAGDLDGDGDDDLVWVSPRGWGLLLWNDGDGSLTPGDRLPGANGVSLSDPDHDGDLDILLLTDDADLLLWNEGDRSFRTIPINEADRMSVSASWADLNGDGILDLFIARYSRELNGELILDEGGEGDGNAIYLGSADGALTHSPDALDELARIGLTFHGAWVDADGDHDLDLYVVNDFGPTATPNRFLENEAGVLTDVSDTCGCDIALFGMGVGVGDPDNDLDPDLFVTNLGPPVYLQNQGDGTFAEAGSATGVQVPDDPVHDTSWGAAFTDVDLDGWEDLLVTFGQLDAPGTLMAEWLAEHDDVVWENIPEQPNVLLHNQAGDGFVDAAATVGFDDVGVTKAVITAQLDSDPQPELVTVGLDELMVYDPGPTASNGIVLTLDAGPTNRFGIGARVDLTVDGERRRRWMTPSSQGSFGSSSPRLFLGLGEAEQATLTVTWPDGSTSEVEAEPGSLHLVR